MSTISTNAIQSVAGTLDLGVQGNIKAKMNADNTFSSVIPGFGDTQFPEFKCRAWVNFNGTNGAIRASGNISSVTRNAAGQYTVSLSTPMPDSNYSILATCSGQGTAYNRLVSVSAIGSSSYVLRTFNAAAATQTDVDDVFTGVIR